MPPTSFHQHVKTGLTEPIFFGYRHQPKKRLFSIEHRLITTSKSIVEYMPRGNFYRPESFISPASEYGLLRSATPDRTASPGALHCWMEPTTGNATMPRNS